MSNNTTNNTTGIDVFKAINDRDIESVRTFIQNAEENYLIFDDFERTPLNLAASLGLADICKVILDSNKDDINYGDQDGHEPIYNAVVGGHYSTAKLLLKHGANIHQLDCKKRSPLYIAVKMGDMEMAKLLVEHSWTTRRLDGLEVPPPIE